MIPANQDPAQWFNPAAFQTAVPGTFGNAGRNILEGPGQINIDLSFFKNFQIGERYRLQFRSEFFNLPNHPNFQGNSMSSNFDQIRSGTDHSGQSVAPDSVCVKVNLLKGTGGC